MSDNRGISKNSLANLIPFEKGQSGNPAGRPKGSFSIKSEVEKLMPVILKGEINPLTDLPEDMPVNRKIALNWIMKAVADGDMMAIRELKDMLDGKAAQSLNLGGQEGNPVETRGTLTVHLVKPKGSHDE